MSVTEVPDTEKNPILRRTRDAEILAHVNSLFNKTRPGRIKFERQWYTNLAFYFGKQWAVWQGANTATNFAKLVEPPAPPWRVRLVSNKIKPIIRAELSKITREKPQFFVVPTTTDEDDIYAARAGEHIAEHLWRELTMNKVIRRAMFWNLICGTSFIKDWYDDSLYDDSEMQGKIQVEHLTPFHLLAPELQEEELENQAFIIHVLAKPAEWVEKKYKKKVTANSSTNSSVLESRFLSALGVSESSNTNKLVEVREIWIKSSKKFPDGGVVTWAGDTVLNMVEGMPYDHGEYPFTKFEHIPAGRFYGDSVINDLIPLQKEYNRTRSQIIEAKNRMSKPQLMAPRGSVEAHKITSEPGLVVFYTPGFAPPQPIPLQSIPGYVIEELNRTQADMDDVSAQHEVTKGRTPPGVTAATAISFLQEEDDSKLSPTVSSLEEGVEKLGRHFLAHVRDNWDAERVIKVTGDNNQWESYAFTGEALKNNINLKVEAGSAAPRSRAAKQAFILELGKMNWIPPDRALRYLDMAETSKLHEELQIDVRQCQREHLKMIAAKTPIPSNPWDNHMIHIQEHENYMKKQEFDKLDDDIKQMIFAHDIHHHAALAFEMGIPLPPGQRLPLNAMMMGGQQPGGQAPPQEKPPPGPPGN